MQSGQINSEMSEGELNPQNNQDESDEFKQAVQTGTQTMQRDMQTGHQTMQSDVQTGHQTMQSEQNDSQMIQEGNNSQFMPTSADKRNIQINQGGDHAHNFQSCGVVNIYNGPVVIGGSSEGSQVAHTRRTEPVDGGLNQNSFIDDEYRDRRNNFQKELVEYYTSIGLTRSPISILFDEEGIDVENIFVMPQIKRNERQMTGCTTKTKPEVVSIEGILQREGRPIKRACVVGDAGYGKTFLCKKIVSSWCRIHSNEQTQKLVDTDIAFLRSFDFLFYLPLRNCKMADVMEMIKEHIVRKALHGSLQEILDKESEKCLIVLDGLDEYSSTVGIPIVDKREKYSIILTSRPWKIELLRPTEHDIGQELILESMQQNDALIKDLVQSLNEKFGEQRDWKKFKRRDEYKKMKRFAEIPVMLIHMICMWYDGENVGNTRTEIYIEMLEYLFKVAHKRRPMQMGYILQRLTPISNQENESSLSRFYEFKGLDSLENSIMSKLADLAFHTLFCQRREEALIFSHDDMDIYKMSKEEVELCLTVGLLSQEKIHRKVTKQEKLLSFIHKTYQEFLAAMYIASKYRIFTDLLDVLDSLNSVLGMSQVLQFLVGLKPEVICELSLHIADILENDGEIIHFRKSLRKKNFGLIYPIQSFIWDCFEEVWKDIKPRDRILIELRDIDIDKYLFLLDKEREKLAWEMIHHLNVHNVKSLSVTSRSFDKRIFGYRCMEQLEKLVLGVISDIDINLASKILSSSTSSFACFELQGLVKGLRVDASDLFDKLSFKSNLTALRLKNLELSLEDLTRMGILFLHFTQLQQLFLGDIKCSTPVDDEYEYSLDLRQNAKLNYLELTGIDGDIILDGQTPLEYVEINSSKHWFKVVGKLKHSVTLKHLCVKLIPNCSVSFQENNILSAGKVFMELLPTLQYLETLSLEQIDLNDNVLTICQAREMEIVLEKIVMTFDCLKRLLDSLLQSPYEKEVRLTEVYINPEHDLYAAAQYIKDHCHIRFDDSKLSDGGYIFLRFTNTK